MKVFLAGTNAGQEHNEKYITRDVYVLESFYYIKDWQKDLSRNNENFLLDSGAFTFMVNTKKQIDWDEYVSSYAKYIKENDVKYFFELDIDSVVGIKEVERLRNKLEYEAGKKCIPVWHKSRGLDYWKKMCEDYEYIAIGGLVNKEIKKTEYKNLKVMIDYAHLKGCRVHGLGFTALRLLHKYNFDTVDSTSWTSGARFGTLYQFKNNKLETISFKNRRAKDGKMINEHNLQEWIKFQKYADRCL